jgi:hypothetical protein
MMTEITEIGANRPRQAGQISALCDHSTAPRTQRPRKGKSDKTASAAPANGRPSTGQCTGLPDLRRRPRDAEHCGLSPQGKRGKTWAEFPLILAAGLWHLARDHQARGDPSCCGGGSSRVLLFGFVAAPSSRLVGRSAWRLGDGGGKPHQNTLRWFRTWLPDRQGCLTAVGLAQPGQGIADQARAEALEAQAASELRLANDARKGRGRWARIRAAWRGK